MNAGETLAVGLNHETGYINKALAQISDSRSRLESELAEITARAESILKTSERKGKVREALMEKLAGLEQRIQATSTKTDELGKIKHRLETESKKAESDFNSSRSRLRAWKGSWKIMKGTKRA
jgi:chromosome segregation ATPase